MWWKRGERPRGIADKRFTFAYIFAAVEPGTDNAFALILPYVNTGMARRKGARRTYKRHTHAPAAVLPRTQSG